MSSLQTKLFKGLSFVSTALMFLSLAPVASAQNLVVTQAQEVRTSAFHGDSLRLRRTIANIEATTAGTFDVQVLLSDDTALGGDTLLTTFTIANIPGNAQDGPTNITVTIPNSVTPGTYFILFNADSGNAVTESNETDNLGVSGPISIQNRPGDINLDGLVQVDDVTAVVNEALGGPLSGRGDINGNGNVDIIDVVGTINVVLNTPPSAMTDTINTNEESPVTFAFPGLLGNDTDLNSATLRVSNFDMISNNGVPVSVQFNGTTTYNPRLFPNVDSIPLGSTALDSFLYTVADDQGGFTTASSTIAIAGVNDNPVATDDMFATAYANTLFGVSQSAPVMVTGSVLNNDMDVDIGDTLTASAATNQNGATINMMSDGSFTYLPALNAVGAQTFNYQVMDNNGGTDTGTVTIMIFPQRIFYVDADAQAGGNGQNVTPFNSLSAANGAANANGDIVYVFDDDLSGTTPGAITLLTGQQLLGNVDLVVNGTTIFTAGGTPTLVNAGNLITIGGDDVTIRGFNITPSTGAAITTGLGVRATLGTLTVSDCLINSANGPAFIAGPTTSGTLAVSLSSMSATNNSPIPALFIARCSGSFSAPVGTLTSNGATGAAVEVRGGSAMVTYGGLINANSRPSAISVLNTGAGASTSFGGTITVNTPQNGVAFALTSNAGSVSFGETNNVMDGLVQVSDSAGTTSFTNVNINNTATNRSGFSFDDSIVTMGNGTADTGTGVPFAALRCALTVNLTSVSSNGSNGSSIDLDTTTGSFTVTGDPADTLGSGGVITRNGAAGAVSLDTATNVTLENMVIGNMNAVADGTADAVVSITNDAILANGVTGLTILNSLISETGGSAIQGVNTTTNLTVTNTRFIDCGNATADEIIDYNNATAELRGTAQFTDCIFADNFGDAITLDNSGGTLDLIWVNVSVNSGTDNGVQILCTGATVNFSASNCSFTDIGINAGANDNAIQATYLSGSTGAINIVNATISNVTGDGIEFNNGPTCSASLTVNGSATDSFTGIDQRGIQVATAPATTSTTVNLRDLTITSELQCLLYSVAGGNFNSNITTQNITTNSFTSNNSQAIQVGVDGGGAIDISPRLNIVNSSFTTNDGGSRPGVFQIANVVSNASILHITADNNSFTTPNIPAVFSMSDNGVICANLTNNAFSNPTGGDLALSNNTAAESFQLDGFAGDGTDTAVVTAFITGQGNTLDPAGGATINFNGRVDFAPGTCLLPPAP